MNENSFMKVNDVAKELGISELKAKITSLTRELYEYKSVRGKLHTAGLEQKNEALRSKLRSYELVIERNHLWSYFSPNRGKTHTRGDAR